VSTKIIYSQTAVRSEETIRLAMTGLSESLSVDGNRTASVCRIDEEELSLNRVLSYAASLLTKALVSLKLILKMKALVTWDFMSCRNSSHVVCLFFYFLQVC
jgi:hypothetical protein